MTRERGTSLAFLALLLPAASVSAGTRFPIGIYGVNNARFFPELREAGFDSFEICIPEYEPMNRIAAEARKAGFRMLACPQPFLASDPTAVKDWPVDAWYLADEPEVTGLSPAELKKTDAATRSWDPGRKRAFVVGTGKAAHRYADIADILMIDWYPVPHLPLDSVADHLDMTREAARGKPVWMVLQAFNWSEMKGGRKGGRFPTREELRFMTYLSLLHGANGLFYYSFSAAGRKMDEFPERFRILTAISREIAQLRPMLEGATPAGIPFELPNPLEAKAWKWQGRDYLIVVNRSDSWTPCPSGLLGAEGWRPLFEPHGSLSLDLAAREGQPGFPAYRVLVLERR